MKEKRNWKKELERETLRDSDNRNKIEKRNRELERETEKVLRETMR